MKNLQIRTIFTFYILSVIIISTILFVPIFYSQITSIMDTQGFAFYTMVCISQAAIFSLPAFLLAVILLKIRLPRVACIVAIGLMALFSIFLIIDIKTYAIYRFHINGMVMNMILGPNATQIFSFGTELYIIAIGTILLSIAIYCALWFISGKIKNIPKQSCNNWHYSYHIALNHWSSPHIRLRLVCSYAINSKKCSTHTISLPSHSSQSNDKTWRNTSANNNHKCCFGRCNLSISSTTNTYTRLCAQYSDDFYRCMEPTFVYA